MTSQAQLRSDDVTRQFAQSSELAQRLLADGFDGPNLLRKIAPITTATSVLAWLLMFGLGQGTRGTAALIAALVSAATVWLVRDEQRHRVAAHFYLGGSVLAVSFSIWLSGGMTSAAAPWIALIPLFAALLLGNRAAVLWLLISTACMLVIGGLQLSGVHIPAAHTSDFHAVAMAVTVVSIGALSALGTVLFTRAQRRSLARLHESATQLQAAVVALHELRELVPFCPQCKCVQTASESGHWQRVEEYISHHSDVSFSHGLCESCEERFYS